MSGGNTGANAAIDSSGVNTWLAVYIFGRGEVAGQAPAQALAGDYMLWFPKVGDVALAKVVTNATNPFTWNASDSYALIRPQS